jgi:hypothetical protein
MLKDDFRRRLRAYGLSEERIEEASRLFERNNDHVDVISFVLLLERFGVSRRDIRDFLKEAGIDDIMLINIFGKVDIKKSDFSSGGITQVVLED